MTEKKKKGGFKVPHLFFLLLGLLMVMSLLTYVLPAGQFVDLEDGSRIYQLVERTPVSPWQALLNIYQGIANSSMILAALLVAGGGVEIGLSTKALDRVIDAAIYKLQDKGSTVLIPAVYLLMTMLGGFGGSDAMVAIVPVGVLLAKKLKLDPIVAVGIGFMAVMTGFSTSPTGTFLAQSLLDVPIYSGFGFRFLNLLLCGSIGAIVLLLYAKKVEKDPTKSAMGDTEWMNDLEDSGPMEAKELNGKDLLITILFFLQFALIIIFNLKLGFGMASFPAIMIPMAIIIGLINGYNTDQIGNIFAKGVSGMGFICFVIGMAGGISLVMSQGHIVDTIAYYASLPLANLGKGLAAVGISAVVAFMNFFIPSASAKVAALMPIVKPMALNLGLTGQVAVQAFQMGDGFMNMVSPFLGWTMGALATAKVPYNKWVKWIIPKIALFLAVEWIILYFLSNAGWTGL